MIRNSGVQLSLKYGYVPCKLGLCGPQDKEKKEIIKKYLEGDDLLEKEIRVVIEQFKGAYPYYQLIAQASEISDPLDFQVVEAYWTGNSLLEKVRVSDIQAMMEEKFVPLGKLSSDKVKKISNDSIPFHNFHVFCIGSVTGTLKETQAGFDLCRVSWGQVEEISKDTVIVRYQPLVLDEKNRKKLGQEKTKAVKWNKIILPNISKGDWISMHWNHAIEKIDVNKKNNLETYSKKVLGIS